MIFDSSSSMEISMDFHSSQGTRFEIAKQVFKEFVTGGRNNLTGRTNDLIGMITFARYPDTICPLTLDHRSLIHFVNKQKIENRPNEDGTAIGDAIALGAGRLKTVENMFKRDLKNSEQEYSIKSKIIILLTDGENNCGRLMPRQGALLAKKWGIKIYTIGFGSAKETKTVKTEHGIRKINVTSGFNAQTLSMIADITGGMFRIAEDADALRSIYRKIGRMEKSEFKTISYLDNKEFFIPFGAGTLSFIFLGTLLGSTILRKIP